MASYHTLKQLLPPLVLVLSLTQSSAVTAQVSGTPTTTPEPRVTQTQERQGNLTLTTDATWSLGHVDAHLVLAEDELRVGDPYTFARERITGYIARAEDVRLQLMAAKTVQATFYAFPKDMIRADLDWLIKDLKGRRKELDDWKTAQLSGRRSAKEMELKAYTSYARATTSFTRVLSAEHATSVAALVIEQGHQKEALRKSFYAQRDDYFDQLFDRSGSSLEDLERSLCDLRKVYVPQERAIDDPIRTQYVAATDSLRRNLAHLTYDLQQLQGYLESTGGQSDSLDVVAKELTNVINPFLKWDHNFHLVTITYGCNSPSGSYLSADARFLSLDLTQLQRDLRAVSTGASHDGSPIFGTRLLAAILVTYGRSTQPVTLQGIDARAMLSHPDGACDWSGWTLLVTAQDSHDLRQTFLVQSPQLLSPVSTPTPSSSYIPNCPAAETNFGQAAKDCMGATQEGRTVSSEPTVIQLRGFFASKEWESNVKTANSYVDLVQKSYDRLAGEKGFEDWSERYEKLGKRLKEAKELASALKDMERAFSPETTANEKAQLLNKYSWKAVKKGLKGLGVEPGAIVLFEMGWDTGTWLGNHFAKGVAAAHISAAERCALVEVLGLTGRLAPSSDVYVQSGGYKLVYRAKDSTWYILTEEPTGPLKDNPILPLLPKKLRESLAPIEYVLLRLPHLY